MIHWDVKLLKEVNGIEFGMKRETVRELLGGEVEEFKKSKFSKTTTDDFGYCHVYYNVEDECEAVEIFEECEVSVNGQVIFPGDIEKAKVVIQDLEEEDGSYISQELSVGIYAPSGEMESILFGERGYYDE